MYKLLNYLFGWDYIVWSNSVASGIARIRVDHNGNVFYWRYITTKVADPIKDANKFLWLTCSPSKYLTISEEE